MLINWPSVTCFRELSTLLSVFKKWNDQ